MVILLVPPAGLEPAAFTSWVSDLKSAVFANFTTGAIVPVEGLEPPKSRS